MRTLLTTGLLLVTEAIASMPPAPVSPFLTPSSWLGLVSASPPTPLCLGFLAGRSSSEQGKSVFTFEYNEDSGDSVRVFTLEYSDDRGDIVSGLALNTTTTSMTL